MGDLGRSNGALFRSHPVAFPDLYFLADPSVSCALYCFVLQSQTAARKVQGLSLFQVIGVVLSSKFTI